MMMNDDISSGGPLLREFRAYRKAEERQRMLMSLLRLSRQRDDVVALAIAALSDRSFLVRSEACGILAYSLRDDVAETLAGLKNHKDEKTRECAEAALDAIRHKNHHYYVDRGRTGSTFWVVTPSDMSS